MKKLHKKKLTVFCNLIYRQEKQAHATTLSAMHPMSGKYNRMFIKYIGCGSPIISFLTISNRIVKLMVYGSSSIILCKSYKIAKYIEA